MNSHHSRPTGHRSPRWPVTLVTAACLIFSGIGPSGRALAQETVYEGEPISLKVVQISVTDFFRTVSELSGLNILIDPEVGGSLTLNVEQVPWDQLFDAVLQSQGLAKRIDGNLIRISTQGKLRTEQEVQQQIREARFLAADTSTVSRRLNYAQGAQLLDTLQPHLTQRGSMNVDARTNTLIITDVPQGLDQVSSLVEILDVPEKQVEIEARIIEASTNFARELGAELGFLFGKSSDRVQAAISTATPATGNVTSINEIHSGRLTGEGLRLDTVTLDALISAGESQGDATILSKPRVTAQNNAEATITQGSQIPVPVQQNFTTTVQFQTAALQLTVTPRVTNVNTVLLDISVQNNIPDFARTVLGIPAIQTSESNTQVLVSDGGTTVIGGIYVDSQSESEDHVPGLGRIPVIGNLFRRSANTKDTREILFFITAWIQQ
jgi:type IV pilus assembly protein PilQ